MSDNIRRSIYLTLEMSEQIETYAAAKHIPFNQAVRQLVEKSLTLTSYADGESMIRQYIHKSDFGENGLQDIALLFRDKYNDCNIPYWTGIRHAVERNAKENNIEPHSDDEEFNGPDNDP